VLENICKSKPLIRDVPDFGSGRSGIRPNPGPDFAGISTVAVHVSRLQLKVMTLVSVASTV